MFGIAEALHSPLNPSPDGLLVAIRQVNFIHPADVAQLVEHHLAKVSPPCGCGSVGRASPCQGEGREFESRHPLQYKDPACWLGLFVNAVQGTQECERRTRGSTRDDVRHRQRYAIRNFDQGPRRLAESGRRGSDRYRYLGVIHQDDRH
ncbi:MAG: hypothetical protein RIS69_505 [Actinomycetota bacterium]